MRAVIQRVSSASVTIDGTVKSSIGEGLMILLGIGRPVGTGEFGADMKVALVNNGPVTICIDTKNKE